MSEPAQVFVLQVLVAGAEVTPVGGGSAESANPFALFACRQAVFILQPPRPFAWNGPSFEYIALILPNSLFK